MDYASVDGTATAPGDYTNTSGTLTFNPGETSKTITVNAAGDLTSELDETFVVDLSNVTNASLTDSQGQGIIQDDDTPYGQWASSVIDFSSEWSSTSWSAAQALGMPDTFAYGDT